MLTFIALALGLGAGKIQAAVAAANGSAPVIPKTRTRVDLHPFQIQQQSNPDDTLWSVEEANSVNTTINDLDFTLTAGNGTTLNGNWNKVIYSKFLATLGERLVGTAVSTDEDNGVPITLTIGGLPDGNHSLLTWHNSWNEASGDLSAVSISVNGVELIKVRVLKLFK